MTSTVIYEGDLRTVATHLQSVAVVARWMALNRRLPPPGPFPAGYSLSHR
jgi:hypothetical protein